MPKTAAKNTLAYGAFNKEDWEQEAKKYGYRYIDQVPENWKNEIQIEQLITQRKKDLKYIRQTRIDHQRTQRTIELAKRLVDHKNNNPQEKPISPEKNIVRNNQLDQLTTDQDWRQDYRDLEQHSKYAMDLRHPHHGNLHFTGCGDDGCGIHMQGKDDADYHPRPALKCLSLRYPSTQ